MVFKKSMSQVWPSLRLLLLFLTVGGMIIVGCGSQTNSSDSLLKEKVASGQRVKAPEFRLKDMSGKSFALADFKGKVVFLDFWATWCPPCVMSSPDVEKMAHDYQGKPVEIISISLDDSSEPVLEFIKNTKMTNRVALAGSSGVDVRYNVRGIPAFFMIDQEGYVVGRWEGYSPAMARLWRKELDRLLKV